MDHLYNILQDVDDCKNSTLVRLIQPYWKTFMQHLSTSEQQELYLQYLYQCHWRTPPVFMIQLIIHYLSINDILILCHLSRVWHTILFSKSIQWQSCVVSLPCTQQEVSWTQQFQIICHSAIFKRVPQLLIPHNFFHDTAIRPYTTLQIDIYPLLTTLPPAPQIHTVILDSPVFAAHHTASCLTFLKQLPHLCCLKLYGGVYAAEMFQMISTELPQVTRITRYSNRKFKVKQSKYRLSIEDDFAEEASYKEHLTQLNLTGTDTISELRLLATPANRWKQVAFHSSFLAEPCCYFLQRQAELEQLVLENLYCVAWYLPEEEDPNALAYIYTGWQDLLIEIGRRCKLQVFRYKGCFLQSKHAPPLDWSLCFTNTLAQSLQELDLDLNSYGTHVFSFVNAFHNVHDDVIFARVHTLRCIVPDYDSLQTIVKHFPNVVHLHLKHQSSSRIVLSVHNLLPLQSLPRLQILQFDSPAWFEQQHPIPILAFLHKHNYRLNQPQQLTQFFQQIIGSSNNTACNE